MDDVVVIVVIFLFLFGLIGMLLWAEHHDGKPSRQERRTQREKAERRLELDKHKADLAAKVKIAEAEARRWEAMAKLTEKEEQP